MAVTIDIVDQDIFRALIVFFRTFIPSEVEIVQQQDNRVPMPKGGFIAMNNNENNIAMIISWKKDAPSDGPTSSTE